MRMSVSSTSALLASVGLALVASSGACNPSRFPNPNGQAQDQAGFSVGIDSTFAIVGVPRSDTLQPNGGKALIYRRSGNSWVLDATIVPADPSHNADFGWSLGISGDRAIVGAFTHAELPYITGAAYFFERVDGAWTEMAHFLGDSAQESGFGASVAISGDYAVVGAALPPPPTFAGPGRAFVYRRDSASGSWTRDTILTASDQIDFIEFGTSVAIDGGVLVVGAERGVKANTIIGGAAYVFRRSGTTWTEEAKLTASDAAYHDFFGASIAVSGNRLLVGAHEQDDEGDAAGATYVFTRNTTTGLWSESQILTPEHSNAGDNFGRAVAIDGGRALIGAWLADGDESTTGAAYVYRMVGSWFELADTLFRLDGEYGDGYGVSVALSGNCGVVGAVNDDISDVPNVGSAFHYCGLPGPGPPEVEIDIICCVQVPDPAGPVIFSSTIVNRGRQTAIGRRWVESSGNDSAGIVVVAPTTLAIPPGDSIVQRHVVARSAVGDRETLGLRWRDTGGVRVRTIRTALANPSAANTLRAR